MQSSTALWLGILFSLGFTALIYLLGPALPQINFLPDTGASWYYWKLPEPTFWSRASVWGLYLGHQIAIWGLIWHAQRQKPKYTAGLHRVNVIALVVNALFIFLHLIQTHVWYDGLAQDVSIFSSQGSVILMLILILLMENQRRGLFFGRKVGFLKETGQVVRRYHGYIFAWAVIYTFWYHPMETSTGHLIGFLYTFLLMLQGSLMFTRAHLNRWWTLVLELAVVAHGTLVALMSNNLWPMFFFGFAAIFIVTQMWGLGLSKWWRWGFIAAYVAAAVAVYSSRGWGNLNEIVRIPVIEYGLVFAAALLIWGIMRLAALAGRSLGRGRPPVASGD
ncbi:MAG: hypothetical protein KIS95_11140 [Anaerolineae bacterium]|nr:hypothetical protein [Anaerolineae bacterium]